MRILPRFFRALFSYITERMSVMRRAISAYATSGVLVTRETAMMNAVYARCVQVLAGDVSSLSLKLYRRLPGGAKEEASDHPHWPLWTVAPNPFQSRQRWVETLMGHLLCWGNSYHEIGVGPGGSLGLFPIHPRSIRPVAFHGDQVIYEYDHPQRGRIVPNPAVILHLRSYSEDGIMGLDPLTQLTNALGLAIAAEGYGAAFFRNNGTPSGVLEHPGVISDSDFEAMKKSWERNNAGPENWHRVTILDRGLKYNAIGIDPEKAQLLLTRKYQRSELAGWFGVPLHRINDLERATFNNTEQMGLEYVVYTLTPWLVRIEQEINRMLYPAGDLFVEFNVASLLRGDAAARAAFYKELFYLGALTINEIRAKENLNPIGELGDVHWMQQNMATAEEMAKPLAARTGDAAKREGAIAARSCENLSSLLLAQTLADARCLAAPGDDDAASIAGRMAATLAERPESQEWTVRQWAEFLQCSPSTVHRSPVWRGVMASREHARQRFISSE